MSELKMKTLKQIFIRKATLKPQTSMTLSVREARNCVKEWLQQKLDDMPKGEFGEKTMLLELLEELKK